MGRLEERVAFITGAASGIGRGCAERLAREGADIAIADIDLEGANKTAERIRALGRKAHMVAMNSASQPQTIDAIDEAVEALGRLDIAVAKTASFARASKR